MSDDYRAKLAARSSVNGLAHCGKAAASQSRTRTWFWSSVTFLFACITTYELSMIVTDYRRYPVLTVVDVSTKREGSNFPTVIICSHNPVPCRNLFPVSLTYPELWEASGCSAGMQIRGYVSDVISEFDSSRSPGEKVPLRKFLPHHDGSAENPLVTLWAHHSVDSPAIRRILAEPDLLQLLGELRAFMDSGWLSSEKLKAASPREALKIQHHFALEHLKEAEIIARFARNEAPVLNNISLSSQHEIGEAVQKGAITSTVSPSSTTNTVASALALHFVQESTWENVSRELKSHWLDAIAHGSEFDEATTKAGRKLCAGLASYYAEKIYEPLARFPELWAIINRPPVVAAALRRISDNLKKILKSKSFRKNRSQALKSPNGTLSTHGDKAQTFERFDELLGKQQIYLSKSARGMQERDSRFHSLFLKLPPEEQNRLLIEEKELVMECSYVGIPCDIIGLTSFTSTVYGKCISFNDHALLETGRSTGPLKTNSLGQDGGLSLQLRIAEDHDYTRDSVRTSGARVTILPFNGPPNVLEDGFDVPISFETNLELSARTLRRLPRPYPSDCQTHWNETDYSFRQHNYDYKACLRFCLGHEIYNTCKCVDPRSKAHQVEYKGQHFEGPWCDYSSPDSPDAICVQRVKVQKREKGGSFPCPCRPACEVLSYDIGTSSTLIFSPAGSRMELCDKHVDDDMSIYSMSGALHEWIPNPCSILRVSVYFGSFDVTETKEEAKYTIFSMASDVGGALSLLLGLCGITVLETLVLFVDMAIEFVRNQRKKSNSAKDVSQSDKTCSRCMALVSDSV